MELQPVKQVAGVLNLQLKLEDTDTKNQATVNLNLFSDQDQKAIYRSCCQAMYDGLAQMGIITKPEEAKMGEDDKAPEQKPEQSQDLTHQKPEETDNLQKSERPSDDYMDSHGLDRETHGKKEH